MLNITGNAAIDVFIGLAFFYFLLSIFCSAINEGIATAFNLRAKDLEKGIRNLLGEQADAFYADARIQALHKPKRFLESLGIPFLKPQRFPRLSKKPFGNKRPSYISSRAFALTALDILAPPDPESDPPPAGGARDLVKRAEGIVEGLKVSNPTVGRLIQDALDEAKGDEVKFRAAFERSFDETMDRVSGWYKRRVQLILIVIALAVVGAMNADSFNVGQRLWKNDALRSAVVAQASAAVKNEPNVPGHYVYGSCGQVHRSGQATGNPPRLDNPALTDGVVDSGKDPRPAPHGLRHHARSSVLVRPAG